MGGEKRAGKEEVRTMVLEFEEREDIGEREVEEEARRKLLVVWQVDGGLG